MAHTVIRMGAGAWDVKVARPDGGHDPFDLRSMGKDDRATFNRLFVEAFRVTRKNTKRKNGKKHIQH